MTRQGNGKSEKPTSVIPVKPRIRRCYSWNAVHKRLRKMIAEKQRELDELQLDLFLAQSELSELKMILKNIDSGMEPFIVNPSEGLPDDLPGA